MRGGTIKCAALRCCKCMIRTVHSIKSIEKCYPTGEEPLLVLCSDMNEYICKYPRTDGAAYKMNTNNTNLLFDVEQNTLVSIDYGCIFNTAMYDYPLSRLTSTDTILASGILGQLKAGVKKQNKLDQLFETKWVNDTWDNFKECFKENLVK